MCFALSIDFNNSLVLYPNPAINTVTISGYEGISQVRVFAMNGQEVMKSKEATFNVAKLKSGLYLVEVLTNEGVFTTRMRKE
ncbi:MAG: T9SS type A sorting domain-containing protein [Cyclobacteriaceae bacterium]